LQAMAQNNPQLKQVMDIVQKHGGDPMTAFQAEARARGMDPNQIMNMRHPTAARFAAHARVYGCDDARHAVARHCQPD
ncbi:MAG: hypothetical protein IKW78_02450, partial [Prevotella sp.]|nr:hypothetical protein [Prevotella sp.]